MADEEDGDRWLKRRNPGNSRGGGRTFREKEKW